MIPKKLAACALLALPLALTACGTSRPVYYSAPPPPPAEYNQAAQQGYNDGIRAAQNDIHKGLPPDIHRHPRFDRPPVPPPLAEDYRHGFRAGYDRVFRDGAPPPPPMR